HTSACAFDFFVEFREFRGVIHGITEASALITLRKNDNTTFPVPIANLQRELFRRLGRRLFPAALCRLPKHALVPYASSHLRRTPGAMSKPNLLNDHKQPRNAQHQQQYGRENQDSCSPPHD